MTEINQSKVSISVQAILPCDGIIDLMKHVCVCVCVFLCVFG